MVHLLLAVIYISFISLGLPDSLLGSAWPMMYGEFGVPVSYAGILSMIIAVGTVISSLQSDRLTRRLGTGKVTVASVAMTALALLGFSLSHSFWLLCLWAIPYGFGAGSVDASLNNYVALHYKSRHMSWLHCMWGVGASVGPYVMGIALMGGQGWNTGYRYIAFIQIALTAILLVSLPLWKRRGVQKSAEMPQEAQSERSNQAPPGVIGKKALKLPEILRISGAKEVMLTFFCYCAVEQTTALWASSYLTLHSGFPAATAARFASLFFIGITVGRALSGFLTMKLNNAQMVRLGQSITAAGALALLFSQSSAVSLGGLLLIGLGCAPIYPCMLHATPQYFGADKSQAIIGIQMASAYIGTCLMPPLFGLVVEHINVALFPAYLLGILVLMFAMHERLLKQKQKGDV